MNTEDSWKDLSSLDVNNLTIEQLLDLNEQIALLRKYSETLAWLEKSPRWAKEFILTPKNADQAKSKYQFLKTNISRAKSRKDGKVNTLTPEYAWWVGHNQDWKCALSGVELEFTRGGYTWGGKWCNPFSCTIDRIDSEKGYIENNIQLVTWQVNCAKRDIPNDEFIAICNAVSSHARI